MQLESAVSEVNRPARTTHAALVIAFLLSACSYLPEMPSLRSLPGLSAIKPYRIDIQQGNFLSPEMVAQLKMGMTREQVRFVLGTPLVTDIFHGDRWDYVFYRELSDGKKEQRRLSVFFVDNKLTRAVGDYVPAEFGGSPAADPKAAAEKAATAKSEATN